MSAVLVLAGSQAIPVSASAAWLVFGVFIAALVSAIGQWIVSAQAKRDRIKRAVLVAASTVGVTVPILWDCGWWTWLCEAMV